MAPKENNECRIFLSEEFKDFLINDFRDKLTLDLLSNFFTVMSSKNMTNKIKEEIIDWWRSLKQNKDKYNNINHKNLAKMVLVDYLKSKNASNLMDPEIKSYKPNETLTFPSSSPNVSPILTGYENSNNTANNKFHIDKNSTQSQNKERSLQRRRISI